MLVRVFTVKVVGNSYHHYRKGRYDCPNNENPSNCKGITHLLSSLRFSRSSLRAKYRKAKEKIISISAISMLAIRLAITVGLLEFLYLVSPHL